VPEHPLDRVPAQVAQRGDREAGLGGQVLSSVVRTSMRVLPGRLQERARVAIEAAQAARYPAAGRVGYRRD
jgi:hypothetical protein